MRTQLTTALLVVLVLVLVQCVSASINPNPKLRVIPIKWGKLILVEEPAAAFFCFIITIMCSYHFYMYHKTRKSHPILENYRFHCKCNSSLPPASIIVLK
jgi:hypothetical protein